MIKFSRRTRNRRFWQTAVLSTAVAMTIIGLLTACQTDAYHRETVSEDGETLVMLTPTDETAAFDNRVERFDFQRIERYEGMRGEGWLNDDTILVTRPNEVIPPVVAFNA
ncbi:MAG: hypothetical protein PWP38_1329, partial [Clostridiales bacterium]|nr:hypothetical protein [Clostridiales bacterium]